MNINLHFSTILSFFLGFKKAKLSQSKESKNFEIIIPYLQPLSHKNISLTQVQVLQILLLAKNVHLS